MKWKVYYSNGTTISDHELTPFSIQVRTGVQVIIVADDESGWRTVTGSDFYIWDIRNGDEGPRWYPANSYDLAFYLSRPGYKCVLFGEFVNKKRYREIMNQALNDPDFGEKSTWGAEERRE